MDNIFLVTGNVVFRGSSPPTPHSQNGAMIQDSNQIISRNSSPVFSPLPRGRRKRRGMAMLMYPCERQMWISLSDLQKPLE